MNTENKMNFRQTSLAMLIIYAIFFAILLLNTIVWKNFNHLWQVAYMIFMWTLSVSPQFILFKYISNFKARWAQLASLILQVIIFIFSLYYCGKILLLMNTEVQPVEMLLSVPIWEIVIILAMGLIFKLIKSY